MAVAVSATGALAGARGGASLTITLTTLTVGASDNGIAGILFVDATSTPATAGITWNGNALTIIGSILLSTGRIAYAFGAIGATVTGNTGAHSLIATITGPLAANVTSLYLNGISFTGVDQGSFANAFRNFVTAGPTTGAGPQGIAVSSNAANKVVAAFLNIGTAIFANGTSSPNASTEWFQQATDTENTEATHATGAATQTMNSTTGATSVNWVALGFDVNSIAAGAGAVEGYTSQIFRPKRSLWR